MKYYNVIAKCGHVGHGKYVDVNFAVIASSKSEAAQKVLSWRKVKKQLKNAITYVEEISFDDYKQLLENNKNNQYLRAHTKIEIINLDLNIQELGFEKHYKSSEEFESRMERISYKMKKQLYRGDYDYGFIY